MTEKTSCDKMAELEDRARENALLNDAVSSTSFLLSEGNPSRIRPGGAVFIFGDAALIAAP